MSKTISLLASLMLVTLFTSTSLTHAQKSQRELLGPGHEEKLPHGFIQTGEMFTVRIIPSEKSAKVFIMGKEGASIGFQNSEIEAKLYVGQKERIVKLIKQRDHYLIKGPLKGDLKLQLRTEKGDNVERFEFKLD